MLVLHLKNVGACKDTLIFNTLSYLKYDLSNNSPNLSDKFIVCINVSKLSLYILSLKDVLIYVNTYILKPNLKFQIFY